MRVKNFKDVKNQFIIEDGHKVVFQSYDSFICEIQVREIQGNRIIKVGKNWDYSRTTMKYLKWFLEEYLWDSPYTSKKDFEKFLENNFNIDNNDNYIID